MARRSHRTLEAAFPSREHVTLGFNLLGADGVHLQEGAGALTVFLIDNGECCYGRHIDR